MDMNGKDVKSHKINTNFVNGMESPKVGLNWESEGEDESRTFLPSKKGGLSKKSGKPRRRVQWFDKNGNKLAENLEFQPRLISESDVSTTTDVGSQQPNDASSTDGNIEPSIDWNESVSHKSDVMNEPKSMMSSVECVGCDLLIRNVLAAAPALVLTVGALFLPETPNSLIHHDNGHEKAKQILQRVRGTDDVQAELDDLIEASNKANAIKHPFKNIIQRKYRPQLVMSIAIPFFVQVTGINVITFYAPVLFRTIGLGVGASLMSAVVTGLVGTSATLLSLVLVDKLGRRLLFHIGGILMFIPQMLIGGIMGAKLGDEGGLSKGYGILVLILICIYVAGFSLSWGPLGWVVTGEIFPLEIRSAAQSINVAVNFFFTFLVGCSDFPNHALPFKVWNILLLGRMGVTNDRICLLFATGNKEYPHRENG
ncbi:Hexose carrier protein hex6 [Forsythia ovata]|uniref:Hexose carrier protein hex6 n=1 Tax=Forsythia ovata TaxID=205694 RepID=A0ABD1X1W6_9LAMI